MNLFVNDIPVHILKPGEAEPDGALFDLVVSGDSDTPTPWRQHRSVMVKNATMAHIDEVIGYISAHNGMVNLARLTATVDDYKGIKAHIKAKFKIIKAAGGIVRKGDKVLMIYRLKKWDLPKGKLEDGEKAKQGAVREVAEECNISVRLDKKVCTTWHTYTMNRRSILKKTTWYAMELKHDGEMKPQREEDIEEVRWMSPRDVYHALKDSYQSINYVLQRYAAQQQQVAPQK